MYKRYDLGDIQKEVIKLLQNNNPMSSTEISKNLKTNRITISKYLDILYNQKILNKKKTGSVNFWFLNPGITNIDLNNEDYSEIQQKLIVALINGEMNIAENIVSSLVNRKIELKKILLEIFLPLYNTIKELYIRDKIGKTEKVQIFTNIANLIILLKSFTKLNKNNLEKIQPIIIVAGDNDSIPICNMIDLYAKNLGFRSSVLGNVESYIDPFFDIDFQRYINKIFNRSKLRILIILISNNERSIKFLFSTLTNEPNFIEKIEIIIFALDNIKEKVEKDIHYHILNKFENILEKIDKE